MKIRRHDQQQERGAAYIREHGHEELTPPTTDLIELERLVMDLRAELYAEREARKQLEAQFIDLTKMIDDTMERAGTSFVALAGLMSQARSTLPASAG